MDLILILLLAAVLCVPLTQLLGLGAIPGYLLAGVLVGPSCLRLVTNVDTMINVSQWGVVMMLFIIGLELSPKRLWAMRNEVFVLGSLQMLACGLLLAVVFGAALRHLAGMEWQAAILCGLSLALSSTAVALRLLDERVLTRTPLGRSALGILLFQDMAAIPMLVAAGLLGSDGASAPSFKEALIAVVVVAAAYRLRLLGWAAKAQLNELFTAAALLMVVGAAQLFDYAGLSAGLGGFLVGVLMAESRYRDDLEKAIDPFKGLLLGLFFVAIGMSVNLKVVANHWPFILVGVFALLLVKALILYGFSRFLGLPRYHRLLFALALAQGGEFSFAIFNEAWDNNLMNLEQRDLLSVIVAISMGVVPMLIKLLERIPENRGGMADLPAAEPVQDEAPKPPAPRDPPPAA
ncbi:MULTISPECIES: cation:proton antiporter domain-containing protein [Achromobacter]|jgi:monovalent cation:proton antiporter-2 (CPA2) family protein|uniref:Cation:proton antiporter n=1 Tax=Achromobacter aegrifaciens TaxID=1287736 RepID=A0AAD2IUH4_ACHAE|nr:MULTISPECIES: cation:proton antiporter [Achromobacter]MBD9381593.1 cation:proton antiporter [Achromobacter sp. ACM02]MBD9421166.1 cation:proton antiporter [Achromobacter sp. ACM04]MBD9431729.1 cation:proton antiporter [Achromobacter sp. ACM03]MBD9474932.1 cation:proton antiporter [Achromobacter sp. ACM01]MDQ1758543.1 cation:proton antiporter [Achromobacter aegrifaciens]